MPLNAVQVLNMPVAFRLKHALSKGARFSIRSRTPQLEMTLRARQSSSPFMILPPMR
jgi:hypothetical protein